jgi:hypothetical protein
MNSTDKGTTFEAAVEKALVGTYASSQFKEFMTIERNVLERGRSGHDHQIDIRIKIHAGLIDLILLCECKCYEQSVPISDVLTLKARVDDCKAAGGILITNVGFQKGAGLIAKENNITLLKLEGQEITSMGGSGRDRENRGLWMIFGRLSRLWPNDLPPGVSIRPITNYRNWIERLFGIATPWADSVEFRWGEASVIFDRFDFILDGKPAPFSDHQSICFELGEGVLMPGERIQKLLMWKALMMAASRGSNDSFNQEEMRQGE